MKNIVTRTITGAMLVAALIAGISINQYTFMLVFGAVMIGSLIEFYGIFTKNNISAQVVSGVVLSLLAFVSGYFLSIGYDIGKILAFVFPVIIIVFVYELFRKQEKSFENIAVTFLGVIYIAIPFTLFWTFAYRQNIYEYNSHLILGFFYLIWTYDTGAYLTGIKFGKNRLFERISPKKSWEGAIGGYLLSIGIAWVLSQFFTDLTFFQWSVYATLVAVFGTLGDLTESMLKRSFDIKDSGSLLPGHGGLLDRFDAVLLAVPAIFVYLHFV